MFTPGACVNGDKESPQFPSRQIRLWGEVVASVGGIMDEIFIIN